MSETASRHLGNGSGTAPVVLLGKGWPNDEPGGLNRYFGDLIAALTDAGEPVRAIVSGPASSAPDVVHAVGRRDEALLTRLGRYVAAAREAAGGAQVVDAHFALYSALPNVLGWLGPGPLVVHFHGPWADESAAAREPRGKVLAKRLIERSVYRDARCIVVLSNAFRRVLVERYGVRPWDIAVIPPGVDLTRFRPGDQWAARRALGVSENAVVALAVRRLVPRMGLDVLLEAWSRIVSARGDLVLLIAGDGPTQAALETQSARLHLDDSVRFLGRVSDDELETCYRAADVCLVPSTALEGFGLVVLESLACGTPVVVSDAGGLPETVAGLDPSLVVRAGDAAALADRLRRAFDGCEPLPSRDACRSFAQRFSWPRAAAAHRELYARAIRPPATRNLRVVYLDHCAKLSGGELALLRLVPALDRVDVHVILGEDGPLVGKLTRAGISVEVFPMPTAARGVRRERFARLPPLAPAFLSSGYAVRLARRLRQLRPDLVHTNSLKAALYGGTAARLAGIPLVWHVRDRIAQDYLPRPAVHLIRALARRLPDGIVANSEETLATLGEAAARGVVVPSPVAADLSTALPERTSSSLTIGMVGRIAPWKGQHVFIEAFARAFPAGDERGVIVGSALFGEEAYECGLRRQVQELGLDGRLKLVGFRDDVAGELRRFDVLAHASVVPEPFGQVVVEGMAAGLPVVAPDAGGPAELVEDGVNGLLYAAGDSASLAATLTRLAGDPRLRERLGRAGREHAKRFAPEVAAAQVREVYENVLRARRKVGRALPTV